MAYGAHFDLNHPQMEAGLESPADEDGVHDSFNQLIAEQSWTEASFDALELQDLQRDLDEDQARRLLNGDAEDEDNGRQTNSLIREPWSSATMKILSSMPSRTIGRNRGAIISDYCNRTMQLRRSRQSRPPIKGFSRSVRPSIRCYGMEGDTTDSADNRQKHLVNNLQNLSVGDRVKVLRAMPLNLTEKNELRRLTLEKNRLPQSSSRLPCCSHLKYRIIIALRHSWYSCLSFLHSLHLWQKPLKRVSGRFGTGVLSYFLFLKTLLFFNVFLFLIMGLFLVLPQAIYPPELRVRTRPFTGLELFTGEGSFTETLMYYGYYSNYTLHDSMADCASKNVSNTSKLPVCESKYPSYNMPLAYFFTIGMAFFITCIILVFSMSKSFGQSFRIDKSHGMLTKKVFCSWDFKVIKKSSVKLMSENICTQLKELLAEVNHKDVKTTILQKLRKLLLHCVAWTLCILTTAACVVGIYFFSDYMHNDRKKRSVDPLSSWVSTEASLLALPVLVSFINILLPSLFNLVALMEDYASPSLRTYVALSRNLMLKVSVLGVLCYHWMSRVASYNKISNCWETFVGQELYRFLIVDFIFTLLEILFGELLWRLFSDKVLYGEGRPVFDIAKNVLDLIYGQTLAWLGVLFSPLLPAVQILKLLLLFCIKMSSVMMNCQAPRRPYRVSQMTTIFISLLCFPSFLGASVCVLYTIWSLQTSPSCGPFSGGKTMFQTVKQCLDKVERENPKLSLLIKAHAYLVENPFFLYVGAIVFLIVIYFYSQVVDCQRRIITLLQEQIKNEGEDKKFLITRLQSIHERKRMPAGRLIRKESRC